MLLFGASIAQEANEKSYTLVTPPDGIETSYYYATGWAGWREGIDFHNVSATYYLRVAFDDKDVYIQGFFDYAPEAWIKGSLDDANHIVFKSNQYLGKAEIDEVNQGDSWLKEDYTMQLNPNDNSLTAYNYAEARISVGESGYIERIGNIQMVKFDTGDADLSIIVPNETAQYIDATFKARDEMLCLGEKTWRGKIGICQDTIYVQNMFSWNNAWIRGILNSQDGSVVFPSGQFLGISRLTPYNTCWSWFDARENHRIADAFSMSLDDEGRSFSTAPEACYILNSSPTSASSLDTLYDLQITLDAPISASGSVGITATTLQPQSTSRFDLFGHPVKGDASGQFVIQGGEIISRR